MYKCHKIIVVILFVVTSFICFMIKADYSEMAESAIATVSIAVGVYIGATSVLLGSNFAEMLKKQPDEKMKAYTKLGVLANYLRIAGGIGLFTIIISTLYTLNLDSTYLFQFLDCFIKDFSFNKIVLRIISSISFGLFFANMFFMWLILAFLINSMTKSV